MSRNWTLAIAATFLCSRAHLYRRAASGTNTALRRRQGAAPRWPQSGGTTSAAGLFRKSADAAIQRHAHPRDGITFSDRRRPAPVRKYPLRAHFRLAAHPVGAVPNS